MDIDFIITWVDGNDPEWQLEKSRYDGTGSDLRPRRYREWETLRYLFRSIEKNAPWVHKVYLVTCGHLPGWLKKDAPKLELVKHEDYIPKEWLPTFSSRTIDMNFHRIKSLSEHFVYFDDDMFITKKTEPEDFFKKGLPCDSATMWSWPSMTLNPGAPYWLAPLINTTVINRHFSKRTSVIKNWSKWFAPCYGKYVLSNLYLLPHRIFTGFVDHHIPCSYLKSACAEVWEKEEELLSETCSHRFRMSDDLNHWVFTYWQFASGRFYPRSPDTGKKILLNTDNINLIESSIRSERYKLLCLNDNSSEEDFDALKERLKKILDAAFPNKSSFEL